MGRQIGVRQLAVQFRRLRHLEGQLHVDLQLPPLDVLLHDVADQRLAAFQFHRRPQLQVQKPPVYRPHGHFERSHVVSGFPAGEPCHR